ncbi:MAG: phosphotransferase [Lachnospiraceae bacterium]|nr:phosphotransferase [Lachnospiraceae bacterium]
MNDRTVSLFDNYELSIQRTRKGRGSIIAETDQGMKILTEFQGYKEKAVFLESAMNRIKENGYPYIDFFLRNKDGEIVTTDHDGRQYVVKDYLPGRECNVRDRTECGRAAQALATLHDCMRHLGAEEQNVPSGEVILCEFDRKNALLKRVRSFMRKCPAKTDFELLFLKEFERFWCQTQAADACLTKELVDALIRDITQNASYCHGDCSHHNLLMADGHVNIVNFEKLRADTPLKDLSHFLRKVLEKNEWNFSYASVILQTYSQIRPLSGADHSYVFGRLTYPEKFVKIAGSYLGQRKSLPAKRQLDKLSSLIDMEAARDDFLLEYQTRYLS